MRVSVRAVELMHSSVRMHAPMQAAQGMHGHAHAAVQAGQVCCACMRILACSRVGGTNRASTQRAAYAPGSSLHTQGPTYSCPSYSTPLDFMVFCVSFSSCEFFQQKQQQQHLQQQHLQQQQEQQQ